MSGDEKLLAWLWVGEQNTRQMGMGAENLFPTNLSLRILSTDPKEATPKGKGLSVKGPYRGHFLTCLVLGRSWGQVLYP